MERRKITEEESENLMENLGRLGADLGAMNGRALLKTIQGALTELDKNYDTSTVPQLQVALSAYMAFAACSVAPVFALLHKAAIEQGVKEQGLTTDKVAADVARVIEDFWEQTGDHCDREALDIFEQASAAGDKRDAEARKAADEMLSTIMAGIQSGKLH